MYSSIIECAKFTELCELIWKQIRLLVKVQCKGCDLESSEHLHACQKLYQEYYLIHAGFLASIYEQHFDQVFDEVTEGVNIGTITRYKKRMLKTKMFSYIIERIQHKSLFSQ